MTEIVFRPNSFPKQEKLCSNKSIDQLFAKGESFIAYPLRVVYYVYEEQDDKQNDQQCDERVSILISVSKRKFKRAVKRNRVKRLVREAYRLNKRELLDSLPANGRHIDIAFLYLKDELPTYGEIEKSILKVVSVMSEKLNKPSDTAK